jgi:hypothetical protein
VVMIMPMIQPRSTIVTQIPAPSENILGFTHSSHSRSVFRQCLEDYCSNYEVGEQTKAIIDVLRRLSTKFGGWDLQNKSGNQYVRLDQPYKDILRYTDALHDEYDRAVGWCTEIYKDSQGYTEDNLLGAHIRFGIFRENGETNLPASRLPDFDSEVRGYFEG